MFAFVYLLSDHFINCTFCC